MAENPTTISVIFDGQFLRPETPLDLEPNTRYLVTIQPNTLGETGGMDGDAWDVLERFTGTVDAPADWSEEHDHYLYGSPKRSSEPS
ncbi:MAG: hypothetical protein QOH93_379 [Chloroflexia bacterium]|jgi:hypothetical protein|nr:hypothetical protein [Chloroflexia bacterium]